MLLHSHRDHVRIHPWLRFLLPVNWLYRKLGAGWTCAAVLSLVIVCNWVPSGSARQQRENLIRSLYDEHPNVLQQPSIPAGCTNAKADFTATESDRSHFSALSMASLRAGPSAADECHHIYLDFGSNVGIQIRKLFQPELYPAQGESILPVFERYFGPAELRRSNVCAFGAEPNPAHIPRLVALQNAYNKQGWRSKIYTRTGVGEAEGWLAVTTEGLAPDDVLSGGARLFPRPGIKAEDPDAVFVLDFPAFFRHAMLGRKQPEACAAAPGRVVMKVDIEGMDEGLLGALLRRGLLCHIDYLYVEHATKELAAMFTWSLRQAGCTTTIVQMDDEGYSFSDFPLPE